MGRLKFILLSMSFLALPLTAFAARQSKEMTRMFAQWSAVPDSTLFRHGLECIRQNKLHDALVIYSVIANRSYKPDASRQEKESAARAFNDIGYIYFYYYYDYQQAFANLQRGRRIAEAEGQLSNLAYIYLNLANVYTILNELQPQDKYFARQSLDFYRRAFDCASRAKAYTVLQPIYNNLIIYALTADNLSAIAKERKLYNSMTFAKGTVLTEYNRMIERAVDLTSKRQYDEALKYARLAYDKVDTHDTPERYRLDALCIKATIYELEKNTAKTIETYYEMSRLANRYNVEDFKPGLYQNISKLYRQLGRRDSSAHYEMMYLKAKDKLVNESRLQTTGEMHFLAELQDANDRVKILDAQHHQQVIIIILCAALTLLAVISLIYFIRKNRRLQRQQQALYDRMQESLRHDDSERQPKYQNSKLSDDTKDKIFDSVRHVMADTETICSPDFSLRTLAEKTGHPYSDLSQTINEKAGKNFNTLLGEYRIREACRRLGDTDTYGRLTIEAIAISVGFKSRTNFVAIFKKMTGLTPSEYQRTARQQSVGK